MRAMIDREHEPSFAGANAGERIAPGARRRRSSGRLLALALLGAAGVAAWLWWSSQTPEPDAAPRASAPAQSAPAPVEPAAPAIQHPIEEAAAPLRANQVEAALVELAGRDAVLKFLQTADFPRRLVATLDNLGREHAPAAAWPVTPSPGRFTTQESGEGQRIAAANAERYRPFVAFVGSLDAASVVALYRRMYPVLQQAYRELGFGDRYLNDRVVEVIDLLLATPDAAQPPLVQLMEVKGPIAPEWPWVRYEFSDPRLQSLPAGQKILLRVGEDNRRQLKAKLRELRSQLVRAPAAAPAR